MVAIALIEPIAAEKPQRFAWSDFNLERIVTVLEATVAFRDDCVSADPQRSGNNSDGLRHSRRCSDTNATLIDLAQRGKTRASNHSTTKSETND